MNAKTIARKPGDFFEEITGVPISECKTTLDAETAVEKHLGHKLEARFYPSTLVSMPSVIPFSEDSSENIAARIDEALGLKT